MSHPDFWRSPEMYTNIFYLDEDPVLAAQMHCDSHVIKMILDTAKILSTVWRVQVNERDDAWVRALNVDWKMPTQAETLLGDTPWLDVTLCGQRIYKAIHENHPAVAWAAMYGGNYNWLYQLGCALLDEYKYRHGKYHVSTPVMQTLELMPPPLLESAGVYCDMAEVMPPQFLASSPIESYRNYYRNAKTHILAYTKRQPPAWVADLAHFKE